MYRPRPPVITSNWIFEKHFFFRPYGMNIKSFANLEHFAEKTKSIGTKLSSADVFQCFRKGRNSRSRHHSGIFMQFLFVCLLLWMYVCGMFWSCTSCNIGPFAMGEMNSWQNSEQLKKTEPIGQFKKLRLIKDFSRWPPVFGHLELQNTKNR